MPSRAGPLRTALVTGANRGIGFEICRQLARRGNAPRSVEEGADTALFLATLPDGGPTGGFFRDRKPIPW